MLSVLQVIRDGVKPYDSFSNPLPTLPNFLPMITKALKELKERREEFLKNATLSFLAGCITYSSSSTLIKTCFFFQACYCGLLATRVLGKIKQKVRFINHSEELSFSTIPLFSPNSFFAFSAGKRLEGKILTWEYGSKSFYIWGNQFNVYLTPKSSQRI